jgi:hypothetical protein
MRARERENKTVARLNRQYRGQRGRPEPPAPLEIFRYKRPSEISRGELLEIREESLDRGRGEPPSELLEEEREARGGEAELLRAIEEPSP